MTKWLGDALNKINIFFFVGSHSEYSLSRIWSDVAFSSFWERKWKGKMKWKCKAEFTMKKRGIFFPGSHWKEFVQSDPGETHVVGFWTSILKSAERVKEGERDRENRTTSLQSSSLSVAITNFSARHYMYGQSPGVWCVSLIPLLFCSQFIIYLFFFFSQALSFFFRLF